MILRAIAAIIGAGLVATGLALSPIPWLAFIWGGGVLLAFGLLSDVREEKE